MLSQKTLILVAEDYQDTREMYGEFLTRAGFGVALASDGLEAVTKAYELGPDLIVMDLSMPGMDGAKANLRLKADMRTKHIPVLLLTAYELEHLSPEISEAGFAGFLTKPCMPNDLIAEINRVLAEIPRPPLAKSAVQSDHAS